jgi:hypothetical protein
MLQAAVTSQTLRPVRLVHLSYVRTSGPNMNTLQILDKVIPLTVPNLDKL